MTAGKLINEVGVEFPSRGICQACRDSSFVGLDGEVEYSALHLYVLASLRILLWKKSSLAVNIGNCAPKKEETIAANIRKVVDQISGVQSLLACPPPPSA